MKLSFQELEQELHGLAGWQHVDGAIQRIFKFNSFMEAIEFVNRVAALAEQKNHHPDIEVRFTKVILTLSTDAEGGVTEKDLELAKSIERLV